MEGGGTGLTACHCGWSVAGEMRLLPLGLSVAALVSLGEEEKLLSPLILVEDRVTATALWGLFAGVFLTPQTVLIQRCFQLCAHLSTFAFSSKKKPR